MVCEIEFKGQEILVKLIVVAGVVSGMIGVASYVNSGAKQSDLLALKQPSRTYDQPLPPKRPVQELSNAPVQRTAESLLNGQPVLNGQPEQRSLSSISAPNPAAPRPKVVRDESVEFCGAETKKGTPCSRRVKGNTRCFQHIGMPKMSSVYEPDDRGQKRTIN